MLNTFRTKIKFWSHLFLWPVIISFIAFYGWSFLDRPVQTNVAARIGEREISLQEVVETRRRLTQYYREMYKDNFERFAASMDFNEMAMDQLVNQALLSRCCRISRCKNLRPGNPGFNQRYSCISEQRSIFDGLLYPGTCARQHDTSTI